MITTDIGAYNEMCLALRTANAGNAVNIGYVPELRYNKVTYAAIAPPDKIWMRFQLIQSGEKKRTLSVPSRITQAGTADLQLFVPVNLKNGAELGMKVAAVMKAAYTRTASVNFYKAVTKDMPREDKWFYTRIQALYDYDTYAS